MKNEVQNKAGRQGSRAWEGKEIFQSDSYRGGLGTSATAHHMSRGNKQQVTTSSKLSDLIKPRPFINLGR